jgi:hypothetical protein
VIRDSRAPFAALRATGSGDSRLLRQFGDIGRRSKKLRRLAVAALWSSVNKPCVLMVEMPRIGNDGIRAY